MSLKILGDYNSVYNTVKNVTNNLNTAHLEKKHQL